jgi:hypothetical protein
MLTMCSAAALLLLLLRRTTLCYLLSIISIISICGAYAKRILGPTKRLASKASKLTKAKKGKKASRSSITLVYAKLAPSSYYRYTIFGAYRWQKYW